MQTEYLFSRLGQTGKMNQGRRRHARALGVGRIGDGNDLLAHFAQ